MPNKMEPVFSMEFGPGDSMYAHRRDLSERSTDKGWNGSVTAGVTYVVELPLLFCVLILSTVSHFHTVLEYAHLPGL